jgi:hypothetical protein
VDGSCSRITCNNDYLDKNGNIADGCEQFDCAAIGGFDNIMAFVKSNAGVATQNLRMSACEFSDQGCSVTQCLAGYTFSDATKPFKLECDVDTKNIAWCLPWISSCLLVPITMFSLED